MKNGSRDVYNQFLTSYTQSFIDKSKYNVPINSISGA